jgi:hypothetical protein
VGIWKDWYERAKVLSDGIYLVFGEFICFKGYPAVGVGILGLTKVYLIFNEICEFS